MRSQVTCSEQYAPVVDQLLSQIAVVDSLQSGLRLREEFPDWSFVTLDGDSISKEGVLTGGNAEGVENALLKRQREIKELIAAKAEWSGKHALAQALLKKTQEQLENVVNDFEGAQKRRLDQELKVSELKKDLERAESEISAAQVSIERHNREWQRLQTESQTLQDKISEFESNANEQRITKVELESSAKELEKSLETVKASIGTLQTESTDLAVALARVEQETQTQERHFIHTQSQLQELNQKLSLMSEASEKNTVVLTDGQMKLEIEKLELEKNLRAAQELQQQISALTNDFQVHLNSQNALSEQLNQARLQKNEWLSKMNESQLRFEQAKMKEQYLVDQMRERYGVHLGEAFERYLGKVTDLVQTEAELKDLRDKLSRLGEVNLSSIQEYQETSERYAFLTQQQADLTEAKEQLRKVIDRINKICAKRFKETFELVNERFTKVFPVLFGGGEARLEMIEDPEKGEIGIDIIAKPPGKKMQNVSLLSGGEKALTAVSLVFSIFLVKPSPYCLLDEVDAPLDDANVSRFNDLVREMSKRSQIIVVTHNKYTMEVASKLYGVTMKERGVSTMVSVNLQDL
jgi:chromosome segregation protein